MRLASWHCMEMKWSLVELLGVVVGGEGGPLLRSEQLEGGRLVD